jgi:hypothetical protein
MKTAIVFIILFPTLLFSQHKVKMATPEDLQSITYSLDADKIEPGEIKLPFGKIEIVDARFDTSKLGFEFNRKFIDLDYKDFKKIKLEGGIANGLQRFYNEYYKNCFNNPEYKLLLVFKTLWIDNRPTRNNNNAGNDLTGGALQNISTKVEYYLKAEENYYPLLRLDTTYQLMQEQLASLKISLIKSNLNFFYCALKSIIEKYDFSELISNVKSGRNISFQQIDSFNNKRFAIPILTQNKISYGVYRNFRELSANHPSVTDFKIKNENLEITGDTAQTHIYLAFADENGLHMNTEYKRSITGLILSDPYRNPLNFNKLKKFIAVRAGNTFDFFVYDYIIVPKTTTGKLLNLVPIGGIGANADKQKLVLSPRQFDMETGIIY